PHSKASPVPNAATIAVEISGPTPGTLIRRRQCGDQVSTAQTTVLPANVINNAA
ncbi:hypothetical protein SAMN05216228_11082, partial [Rhizobium tibeticum]